MDMLIEIGKLLPNAEAHSLTMANAFLNEIARRSPVLKLKQKKPDDLFAQPNAAELSIISERRPNLHTLDLSEFKGNRKEKFRTSQEQTEAFPEILAERIKTLHAPWSSGNLAKFSKLETVYLYGTIKADHDAQDISAVCITDIQAKTLDLTKLRLQQNIRAEVSAQEKLCALVQQLPAELKTGVHTLCARFFVPLNKFTSLKKVHFATLTLRDAHYCLKAYPGIVDLSNTQLVFDYLDYAAAYGSHHEEARMAALLSGEREKCLNLMRAEDFDTRAMNTLYIRLRRRFKLLLMDANATDHRPHPQRC
ncbi:MAG: hypothetical protein V4623_08755 [Pseudomonadota bacterium]